MLVLACTAPLGSSVPTYRGQVLCLLEIREGVVSDFLGSLFASGRTFS
jgi:hypothetical protein